MTGVMTIDEIRELLDLFNASGVGELEIEREGERIRIRKVGLAPEYTVSPVNAQPQETAVSSEAAATAPGETLVKSPIVGTYYDAASPDSAPFVNVGDAVEPGQVRHEEQVT